MTTTAADTEPSKPISSRPSRGRLSVSCSNCSSAHRRCNREKPICGACLRRPVQDPSCEYRQLGTEANTPGTVLIAPDMAHTVAHSSQDFAVLGHSSVWHINPILSYDGAHEEAAALRLASIHTTYEGAAQAIREGSPATVAWDHRQQHAAGTVPSPPQDDPILSTTYTEPVPIDSWTNRPEGLSASHAEVPVVRYVSCSHPDCDGHAWSLDWKGSVSTVIEGKVIVIDPSGRIHQQSSAGTSYIHDLA